MAYRYEITVMRDETPLETIQLFPDNSVIPSIHHYIEKEFNTSEVFFEAELSEKELNDLYKIVDNYCLEMAKADGNRYIDTLKDYDAAYLNDFGLNNIYLLNSFYILTSARFCNFLLKTEATDGFCQPFTINKDFKIMFSYG
jgi:hypothetical protein